MALSFYMDHHVPRAITIGLRLRGVDVLTAHEDGSSRLPDHILLGRATDLQRVLFTQDHDLLTEATQCQEAGTRFSGVVFGHPLRVSIGDCVRDLELIAKAGEPQDLANRVEFLPL